MVRVMAADKPDRLNWLDPDAVDAFLRDVAGRVEDLVSVAEDQTDPPSLRTYGRAGARDLVNEAAGALRSLLLFARRGLPDAPEKESEP
jgi:hypothetical protein